jgi:hypothetical protein
MIIALAIAALLVMPVVLWLVARQWPAAWIAPPVVAVTAIVLAPQILGSPCISVEGCPDGSSATAALITIYAVAVLIVWAATGFLYVVVEGVRDVLRHRADRRTV